MKRNINLIIAMLLLIFNIANASVEYFQKGGSSLVKMRGILNVDWEEDENGTAVCGKLYGMQFKPEDERAFGGQILTLYSINMDYYKNYDEKMFERENKETEKLLKNILPNEKIWKTRKGRLQKPVEVTIDLNNIKTLTECDYTSIYSKVDEIKLIKSTSAKIEYDEEGISHGVNRDRNATLHYEVYSKDGYANMRKYPDKNSQVTVKISNGESLHMGVPVGEWYYFYKNGYSERKSYGGFIHKSQVEKAYGEIFAVESREGYTNMREKPNSNSKILKTLKNGDKVEKFGADGDWITIELGYDKSKGNYIEGYIHRSQLRKVE